MVRVRVRARVIRVIRVIGVGVRRSGVVGKPAAHGMSHLTLETLTLPLPLTLTLTRQLTV